MQEKSGDYREYGVFGPPALIGQQMALHHHGPDGPRLDELSAEQVEFARSCAREVERAHRPLIQELTSWAEACTLPLDEALFYFSVGMTETSRRGRSRKNPTQAESAAGPDHVAPAENRNCSTVGVMTRDGPVIGRNFDLHYRVRVRHLISTNPKGYLPHTGMYDGLVAGRTDGMNNAGLFASLHTVRAHPPGKRWPGLFCVYLVRTVLETCRTAHEAADRLQTMPHLSPFNYFLADPDEMLVVEAHPERTRVRHAVNGVLACTNHYTHPEMSDLLYAVPANSAARLAFLTQGVTSLALHPQGVVSPASPANREEASCRIASLMADHSVPVCWHTQTMSTLWSAIASPATGSIQYSLGAPCRNRYSHPMRSTRPTPPSPSPRPA